MNWLERNPLPALIIGGIIFIILGVSCYRKAFGQTQAPIHFHHQGTCVSLRRDVLKIEVRGKVQRSEQDKGKQIYQKGLEITFVD